MWKLFLLLIPNVEVLPAKIGSTRGFLFNENMLTVSHTTDDWQVTEKMNES